MRMFVLLVSLFANTNAAFSATKSQLGVAASNTYNRPDDVAIDSPTSQRVRIPLSFKTWSLVETKDADGRSRKSRIASKPMAQVLRARIERANDFYLGDFRIKTTPVRWLKRSNQYQVKLEMFKRLNLDGTMEETLGSVTLTGVLEQQDDGLFILNGTARRLFRDRSGEPILDLDAGQHAPLEKASAISRR
jgi:hypothetical protein